MASLTDEDGAVYLHESVVRGHHIYKRVLSPTVGEVLQLTREERNDHDRFAVWRIRSPSASSLWYSSSSSVCRVAGYPR